MDDQKDVCLHEMFIKQARKTPNTTAVVSDDGRSLTFKELDEITDTLALHFRHRGCGKDQVVGIYLDKCFEYPIAYIAALKAGGAYLPLELSYPEPLLASILKDASPVTVVTTEDLRGRIPSSTHVTVLNKAWKARLDKENESLGDLPPLQSSLDDLAYVVYSSGTTGQPKGILDSYIAKTTMIVIIYIIIIGFLIKKKFYSSEIAIRTALLFVNYFQ